jgi:mono/diheme cytochrome c family protein
LLNLVLAALLLALLGANLTIGSRDVTTRNYEFLPTMVHSVPLNAYSAFPDLPGGMGMQVPPAGTIARGRMPLHFGPGPEEALRAAEQLVDPLATSADPARGQHLFQVYCQLCHGPEGRGDGPVAQRGFPAPPAFNSETTAALRDGQIFHIVTFGQNNMPGHAGQLDPEDRWQLVSHVRGLRSKLQEESAAPLEPPLSDAVPAEPTLEASTPMSEAEVQP